MDNKYQTGHYLIIRDGDVFVETRDAFGTPYWSVTDGEQPETPPTMYVKRWKVGRWYNTWEFEQDNTGASFTGTRLTETVNYGQYEYRDPSNRTVEYWVINGDRKPDETENYPIPAPKIRATQECRWEIDHYEVRGKTTGWRRA